MAPPIMGGMSPAQTAAQQALSQGVKMPEFNSQQFQSPGGPALGGTGQLGFNDPFTTGGGGMGGMGGGGNVGAALKQSAQMIVQSNRQLAQSIDKLAAAIGSGGGPGGGPGGPGRRPGDDDPNGRKYGYGGSMRTFGSFMRNTAFNAGIQGVERNGIFGFRGRSARMRGIVKNFGGLFMNAGLDTITGVASGAISTMRRLENTESREAYADAFEDISRGAGIQQTVAINNLQGMAGVRQAGMQRTMAGISQIQGPTQFATMAGQMAVMQARANPNQFQMIARTAENRAIQGFVSNQFIQGGPGGNGGLLGRIRMLMPSATRQIQTAMLQGIPFSGIRNIAGAGAVEEEVYNRGLSMTREIRNAHINATIPGHIAEQESRIREEAEQKAIQEIVLPVRRINLSQGIGSATDVAGRYNVRAQFGSTRHINDAVAQARFQAANRAKAASITALQTLGTTARGMEGQMVNFFGNVMGGQINGLSGVAGFGTPNQATIGGLLGGNQLSMTSSLGMAGDSLGITTTQMGGILNNVAMAQGFAGFGIQRVLGRMGTQRVTRAGERIARGVEDAQYTPSGEHQFLTQSMVRGAMQAGISASTIGQAASLGAAGTGLNRMMGDGGTGAGVLREIQRLGLRGTGAAAFIGQMRNVVDSGAQRGVMMDPVAMERSMATFIASGRGTRFGELFAGGGGMRQFANAQAKGDVSQRFANMMGDFGSSILMMQALRDSAGDPVKAQELSAGYTTEQKRDIIFNNVQSESGRRRAFMSLKYTPGQIEALMNMDSARTDQMRQGNITENEKAMQNTLLASDAENQIQDARAAEESRVNLESLNVANQILRANVASKAKLDDILRELKRLNIGTTGRNEGIRQTRRALGNR